MDPEKTITEETYKTGNVTPPPFLEFDQFGSGLPGEELGSDLQLPLEQFTERHGRWFFVVHVDDIARASETGAGTLVRVGVTMGRDGMYVFPLVPTGAGPPHYVSLGRSSDNDVRIPHASVSRTHCVFRFKDDDIIVHDENSSFGTFVSGRKVGEVDHAPEDGYDGASLRIGQISGMLVHVETLRELLSG